MGMIDKSLERVFTQLYNGNAGLAIVELDVYLMAWPNPQSRERLDTLKEELARLAAEQAAKEAAEQGTLRLLQNLKCDRRNRYAECVSSLLLCLING